MEKYYGQFEVDKYLDAEIFNKKKDGYYVDIGAYDGVCGSNTYFFANVGWHGICVEPIKKAYENIKSTRKNCVCFNGVVSGGSEEECGFMHVEGAPEMLSGIIENFDIRHESRIDAEIERDGGNKQTIKSKNFLFSSVVDQKKIDLLDIDTEGGELKILQSIDFNKYHISVLLVENNYGDSSLHDFLCVTTEKFYFHRNVGPNSIFINKEDLHQGLVGIKT